MLSTLSSSTGVEGITGRRFALGEALLFWLLRQASLTPDHVTSGDKNLSFRRLQFWNIGRIKNLQRLLRRQPLPLRRCRSEKQLVTKKPPAV